MTSQRVFAVLVRLYPAAFRRQYGQDIIDATVQLQRERRDTPVRFWMFVVWDTLRSAGREHGRTWRLHGFTAWVAACTVGTTATALVFGVLIRSRLPMTPHVPWDPAAWNPYAVLSAMGLAVLAWLTRRRSILVRTATRHLLLSVLVIGLSFAGIPAGLPAFFAIANSSFRLGGVPGGLAGILLPAALVISIEWLFVRRDAGVAPWTLASVVAIPAAVISVLWGSEPLEHAHMWTATFAQALQWFVLTPSIAGLMLGMFTAKGMTSLSQ